MKKPKDYGKGRICDCGKAINRYNRGDKCYQCENGENFIPTSPKMNYRQSGRSGRAINRTQFMYSGASR